MNTDTQSGESRHWQMVTLLLCALFVLLYLAFLGMRPLMIPDEIRYGEISREMIATGNWIVPRINGLLYFEKPPFGHWMNALSLMVFGETPFAVRFASAISAGASACLVFFVGRHLFASRLVPYLAAFVFLTTLEVQAVATYSVLDTMFALYLNVGIALFAVSASVSGKSRYYYLVLSGIFLGVAFLTKGLLAFAVPVLAVVPWLLFNRQYDLLLRDSWTAVVVAVLIIAPWGIAIHLQQPDFWHYFFWVEHVQRFVAKNAQHKEPIYYFLMYLPFVAFPWIFLLPGAIKGLRRRDSSTDRQKSVLLLTSWALLPFLFFSVAGGKLITYILPCFVPFSLLIAVGLNEMLADRKAHRVAISVASAGLFLFLAALIFVYVRPPEEPIFLDVEVMKIAALAGTLVLALGALAYSLYTENSMRRLLSFGLAVVPFLVVLPMSLPDLTMRSKAPVAFLESEYGHLPDDTVIVTTGYMLRAVTWTLKRHDVFVIENGGETTYGLASPDAAGQFLSTEMLSDLVNSGVAVLVICKKGCHSYTMDVLPERAVMSSYGNFTGYYVKPLPVQFGQ